MRYPTLFPARLLIAISSLLLCAIAVAWFWRTRHPLHRLQGPSLVYWAWERPEDLRLLDPKKEAVAFLTSSVELLPDGVKVSPRMQPLLLAPGTQLISVVRIYSHSSAPASLD